MSMKKNKRCMQQLSDAMYEIYHFDMPGKLSVLDILVLAELYINPGLTMAEAERKFRVPALSTIQRTFNSFRSMKLVVQKPLRKQHPNAKGTYLSAKGKKLAAAILWGFKG